MDKALLDELMKPSAIIKQDYRLEILTPMAVHGAGQRANDRSSSESEFRISSLRGVLHYWWRVIRMELTREELLKKEHSYFGGTDEGSGGKSPVRFSWENQTLNVQRSELLPHRKFSNKNGNKKQALNPGQQVNLRSEIRKTSSKNSEDDYHHMLELVFMIASMGQRSRRGFGAIQWTEHHFRTTADYAEHLKSVLLKLERQAEIKCGGQQIILTDALQLERPTLSAVWIGEGEREYITVLEKFGLASHERRGDPGLGSIKSGKAGKRWASPLWGTVRRIGDQYYPVISELQSKETSREKSYVVQRNQFLKHMGVNIVGQD